MLSQRNIGRRSRLRSTRERFSGGERFGRIHLDEQRQGDNKAAPSTRRTVDRDRASMLFGDALGNGETQSQARTEAGVFSAVETVKHFGQIGFGNTNARIGDGYDLPVPLQ